MLNLKIECLHIEQLELRNPNILITFFESVNNAALFLLEYKKDNLAMVALNAEKVIYLQKHPHAYGNIKNVVFYPDGAPICWLNAKSKPRIPGVELWLELLKVANKRNHKVAVIGASPFVLASAEEILTSRFENLNFKFMHGYNNEADYQQFICEFKPDFVFISMGSPKQEKLIAILQENLSTTVFMGIGGSLDILSGREKRAPRIFRENGLEFLYRLVKNPKRIKRQVVYILFLYQYIIGHFRPVGQSNRAGRK